MKKHNRSTDLGSLARYEKSNHINYSRSIMKTHIDYDRSIMVDLLWKTIIDLEKPNHIDCGRSIMKNHIDYGRFITVDLSWKNIIYEKPNTCTICMFIIVPVFSFL